MHTRALTLGLLALAALLSCQEAATPPTKGTAILPVTPPPSGQQPMLPDTTAYQVGDSTLPVITPQPVDVEVPISPNTDTRIVLHAIPEGPSSCTRPQQLGFDCVTQTATTTVDSGQVVIIYVYLIGYEAVTGIQLQFSWDPSWTFDSWAGNCRPGSVEVQTPSADAGDYVAAFNPIRGGALLPIGRLYMIAGNPGTMVTITESIFPGGTGVLTAGQRGMFVSVPAGQRGAIGVEVPGVDTCQPSGLRSGGGRRP